MVAALITLKSSATDIAFLGGTSGDLSLPANWTGGALPTTADVGVIDAGGGDSATYTLSADVSFGGLRIAKAATTTTFSGAKLTLGSSGLTIDTTSTAADVVRFNNSFATTCDQTWNFGNVVRTRLNGTITGTHALLLSASNSSYLLFDKAPAYSGTLTTSGFLQIHAYDAGTYAQNVDFKQLNGRAEFMLTNEIAFATLFPGRVGAWQYDVLWKHRQYPAEGYSDNGEYVTLDIADGDAIFVSERRALVLDGGTFRMTGGSVSAASKFSLGYANLPALFDMSGGTFDAGWLLVGSRAWGEAHELRLSGGTATVATNIVVGYEGGGPLGQALVSVCGGSLAVNGTEADHGIVLAPMNTSAGTVTRGPNATLAVSGGTTRTTQVAFGFPGDYATDYQINSNGWCELSLAGGTLEIGKYGLRLGSRWNSVTDTNATSRTRLTGGTLAASAPFQSTVPLTLAPSATPVTLNTGANAVTLVAPVSGAGTLRKTGSGTLALADAAPFGGSLDVAEGTVRLVGSTGVDIASDDCYRWTGDGAAAGKSANAAVLSWTDANGGVTATGSNGGRVAKGIFNGHDGVTFAGTQLDIPAAINPIAGETNFTAVLVFRFDKRPVSTGDNWYQMTQLLGWEQGGVANDWGLCANNAWRLCGGFGMAGWQDHSYLSSSDRIIDDGLAHVAIVTWHNGDQIIHLDGYETTNTLNLTTLYPRGDYSFRFAGSNVYGSYAEVRLYKDRILTLAERQSIGRALLRTYGGYDATAAYEKNDPSAEETIDDQYATAAAYEDDAIAVWSADSLAATTEPGASVSAWPASVGDYSATLVAGKTAPTFVSRAMNGHAALEFAHAKNTLLEVAASASPFVGRSNFTVAVVFRTTHTDLPDTTVFYQMAGIVGKELGGSHRGDFGLGLVKGGYPIVGSGQRNECDYTLGKTTHRPYAVTDGLPHVLVYSCNVEDATVTYVTALDGVWEPASWASGYALKTIESVAVQFGGADSSYRFTGEIAEIRVYDKALGPGEVKKLARACCAKYGIVPLAVAAGDYGATGRSGLGATNVTIAAGATLALPRSATKPYTLKEGVAFNCLGSVTGSLRVGSGATLDLANQQPAALDDLQLADGATLAVDAANLRTIASFEATGTVTVEIENLSSPVRHRIPILSFTDSADVSSATLVTSPSLPGYTLKVNGGRKTVDLHKTGGLIFTIR